MGWFLLLHRRSGGTPDTASVFKESLNNSRRLGNYEPFQRPELRVLDLLRLSLAGLIAG